MTEQTDLQALGKTYKIQDPWSQEVTGSMTVLSGDFLKKFLGEYDFDGSQDYGEYMEGVMKKLSSFATDIHEIMWVQVDISDTQEVQKLAQEAVNKGYSYLVLETSL